MKALYLTGSIILTVLILIVAFGNVHAQCSQLVFLLYGIDQNPAVLILGVAVLGIVTGAMYHAFIGRVLASPDDDEEQTF